MEFLTPNFKAFLFGIKEQRTVHPVEVNYFTFAIPTCNTDYTYKRFFFQGVPDPVKLTAFVSKESLSKVTHYEKQ